MSSRPFCLVPETGHPLRSYELALFAGIGGFLFFGEPLGAMLLVGGVVSLTAIVLIRVSDIRSS